MRVIYNTCFADPWLKVAEALKEKHGFEPVYWIGYDDDDSKKAVPAVFPDAIYHDYYDAWKGIFPVAIGKRYSQANINVDFIREYASYELQALKMMDRMDPDRHSFSFSERQRHFRNFLKNWTACIDRLKPELVISAVLPHRVYDYALYLLCRHLHIPYLTFQTTAFRGRIIPLRDGFSANAKIGSDYAAIMRAQPDGRALLADLDPDILENYRNVQKEYESAAPAYMVINERLHAQSANHVMLAKKLVGETIKYPAKYFGGKGYLLRGFPTYFKCRKESIEASRLNIFQYAINKSKTNRYKKKLKEYYDSLSATPDLNEPYIYLPLHYQPEKTSSPAGDIFVDQFLCVETLVKNIPHDWKIYVKEHQAQFQAHNEGHTSRIKEFYDDLLKYPNVRLLPLPEDPFKLIANARAVATVTGTVGWEAMARRKPVLVFGSAWYENYPGVLKIADEKAAARIGDFIRDFSFAEDKLLGYLAALQKNSFRAYYYRGLKEALNLPEKECVENLLAAVQGSLKKQ